jgi:hypothetical protein
MATPLPLNAQHVLDLLPPYPIVLVTVGAHVVCRACGSSTAAGRASGNAGTDVRTSRLCSRGCCDSAAMIEWKR